MTSSAPLDRPAWVRRAILLSRLTIAWNLVEGIVSIVLGESGESLALLGFGVDSFIEVGSAMLVLWRFRREEVDGSLPDLRRERLATRGIGLLFILLGTGVAAGAILTLVRGGHPETTLPGVVISAVSLSFMFALWRAKLRVAVALHSATVAQDAGCSLACIQLSVILLVGSGLYALVPALGWVDSATALLLAVLILREGVTTVRRTYRADFAGGCGCAAEGHGSPETGR